MDKNRWQQATALFHQAVEIPGPERLAWLERHCPDDALRADVLALLDGDESDYDPAASIRHSVAGLGESANEEQSLVGKTVGVWRLLEQIGAGGMGTVYRAERCDGNFEQRAAVKLLNPAMLTAESRRRFQAERQILARLRHPNIAHLLDGGQTGDGIPYLVMEYIEGARVDEYCTEARLDIKQRCELMITICEAVQFAHSRLIVHRDLKPSNILVEPDGTVKLLDFGIAKLLEDDSGAITRSHFGVPMTPRFASPEQQMGQSVTTASDVYSIGVLMYRLLSGEWPAEEGDSRSTTRKPSAARGTSTNAAIEERRKRRRKALDGDLDNIVMMALRKDPERRYASAAAMADDIRRFLRHQPVAAHADAWSYRTARFIRRHRHGFIVTTLVLATLVATVTFFTHRLALERDRAELEAEKANQVADFLAGIFEKADPITASGGVLTAVDLLDQGTKDIADESALSPEIRGYLLHVMSLSYRELDQLDKARDTATAAIDALRLAGPDSGTRLIRSLVEAGHILRAQGRYTPALSYLLEARELADDLAPDDNDIELNILNSIGLIYKQLGELDQARSSLEEALRLSVTMYGELDPESIDIMNNLGITLMQLGQYRAAEGYLCFAADAGDSVMPRLHSNLAVFINNCGNALASLGYFEDALERSQDSYQRRVELGGETALGTLYCQLSMARTLTRLNRFDEANQALAKARVVMETHLEPGNPVWGPYFRDLGTLRFREQHNIEAAEAYEKAYRIYLNAFGPEHINTRLGAIHLARALLRQDETTRATALIANTGDALDRRFAPGNMVIYPLELARAELARATGDAEAARAHYTTAIGYCIDEVGANGYCLDAPSAALEALES